MIWCCISSRHPLASEHWYRYPLSLSIFSPLVVVVAEIAVMVQPTHEEVIHMNLIWRCPLLPVWSLRSCISLLIPPLETSTLVAFSLVASSRSYHNGWPHRSWNSRRLPYCDHWDTKAAIKISTLNEVILEGKVDFVIDLAWSPQRSLDSEMHPPKVGFITHKCIMKAAR